MGLWQSVFGKKKKKQQGEDAIYHIPEPFVVYQITRLDPKEYNGVEIDGVIGGPLDGMTIPELESWPKSKFGGGRYRARIHSQEQKGKYLCLHTWKLPGVPLLDGKEIPRQEKASKSKAEEGSKEVARIKEEEEMFVARNARDKREAEWLKTRKQSGLDGGDGDEYEEEEEDDSEKELLRAQLEEMKEQRKEDERRRHEEEKERKWHDEMKAMREESDKRFAAMMEKMEGQKQGNDMQTMTQMVVKATEASAASTKDMMTQMIGILSTPSAASKEAAEARQQLMTVINTQLEQLRSSGNNSIDNALGLFTKAIDMANQYAASGGSQESMWMMVLKEVSSGIKGAVEALTQAKQPQSPPKLQAPPVDAGRITDLAKKGAEQVIKQEAQRKLETTDTAVSTTGVAENPVVVKEKVAPKEEKKVSREEISATRRTTLINQWLEILAIEMKEKANATTWPDYAYNYLPQDILALLKGINDLNDIPKLADVLRKDGDGKLVDETLIAMQKDPSAVKWLWQGIQEIQAADAEPDGNVDTTDE